MIIIVIISLIIDVKNPIISYPAARKTSSVLHYYYNATKKEFICSTLVVAAVFDTCRESLAITCRNLENWNFLHNFIIILL